VREGRVLLTNVPYPLDEISTLLEELSPHLNHTHFLHAFRNMLLALGMYGHIIRSLLRRCTALKPSDTEFLDCENAVVTEFKLMLE
jgi:hypothetical protein